MTKYSFKRQQIILFLLIGILTGCGSSKSNIITTKKAAGWRYSQPKQNSDQATKTTASKPLVVNDIVKAYVVQYNTIAMDNMKNYGIPASIILAQGILESGAGKGELAMSANNHFGIKCHNDWTGEREYHDDDQTQECFRKYNNVSESYKDHTAFLSSKNRYAALFTLPKGDYKAWAKGLKDAGYATDVKYPDKLIAYIESYNLHQYDDIVLGKKISINGNDVSLYEIQKGDTLYSVSKKFNLSIDELKQKNNLMENTLSIGQKLIVK